MIKRKLKPLDKQEREFLKRWKEKRKQYLESRKNKMHFN